IDGMVVEPTFQADVARELIAHDVGAALDMFNDFALNRLSRQVLRLHRAEITAALQHAKHGSFADAPSSDVLPLPFVLIALLAADKGFVDFDLTAKRPIERFGLSSF